MNPAEQELISQAGDLGNQLELMILWRVLISTVLFLFALYWVIRLAVSHALAKHQASQTSAAPVATASLPPTKFDELRDARRGTEDRRFQP